MGLFGFGKKEKDKMKDGLEKTRTGFWGKIGRASCRERVSSPV